MPAEVLDRLDVQLQVSRARQTFERDPFGLGTTQRRDEARAPEVDADMTRSIATQGVSGAGGPLPFLDVIQGSFGSDLSDVRAHIGGPAADAASAIGASAYAAGNHVAFAGPPDLHTAAHEAAHVVQQRGGVQLAGGVGQEGDPYERHADAVADAVVRGDSAAPLLLAPAGDFTKGGAVQRRETSDALPAEARALVTPEQQRISVATSQLRILEDRAERVWRAVERGARAAHEGCADLTAIVGESLTPVVFLTGAFGRVAGEQQAIDEAAISRNPFRSSKAARDADRIAPEAKAVDAVRAEVFDSLDNLTRLSLQTMRLAPEGTERLTLASMVDTLSIQARPMGWGRPASVEEASERRFAHEACPDGAMDERPDVCTMSDGERVELRRQIARKLTETAKAFLAACNEHKAEIQAMINADRDIGQLIGGLAIDIITASLGGNAASAARRGTAKAGAAEAGLAPVAGHAEQRAVTELAHRHAPAAHTSDAGATGIDVTRLASVFQKHLLKPAMKMGTSKAPGATTGSGEERTMAALAELSRSFDAALKELEGGLLGFDDATLYTLHSTVAMLDDDAVKARVAGFAAAYQAQIAPIGTLDPIFAQSLARDLPATVALNAARIHPLQGAPRLALVRHATDVAPSVRRAKRAAATGAMGIARWASDRVRPAPEADVRDAGAVAAGAAPAAASGGVGTARADREVPANAPGPGADAEAEQFYFVRWIDDELAHLADADAIDVSSLVVRGVPWGDANEE